MTISFNGSQNKKVTSHTVVMWFGSAKKDEETFIWPRWMCDHDNCLICWLEKLSINHWVKNVMDIIRMLIFQLCVFIIYTFLWYDEIIKEKKKRESVCVCVFMYVLVKVYKILG